ncbi:unnamed protein product [Ceutorhynchus assimilis]|uniref:Zinc phosphodiesterase ELAC protein 2 n=1 Tax=Ceutorhynchus assimilis TaxID=467358 RepID=A0A9N9QNY2_9CUCU|nr:unnamed protein product [Ceutorhynchus assimilis]
MSLLPNVSNFRFIVTPFTRFYSKTEKTNSNLLKLLKTMPKEPKHIAEAQKQRLRIKQKNSKFAPGKVTVQILGTGAKGAPRSVYLFSDQSRYLFNCGEGTQRLAHEHKTKLAKLEHIFITHPVWRNIGGLPGTALTIQDVGVPQIILHGPVELNELFPATRRFVVIRDLKIKMADCSENSCFVDNVMTVKYVWLTRTLPEETDKAIQVGTENNDATTSTKSKNRSSRKRSSSRHRNESEIFEDNTDYYAHERKKKRSKSRTQSQNPTESGTRTIQETAPSVTQTILKECKEMDLSICYICQLQPRPGTLNLNKCVQKGVPPGPLLGKLKNGETVTLANGTVVKSSEVCEPDDPGPIFIVVDCPSPEHLESLVNNPELKKHQKYATSDGDVACLVIHFTTKEIMLLPEYKEWMDNFPLSTEHIPVNELNSCMGSIAVHRIQHKLNMLSSDFFPLLHEKGTPFLDEDIDNHQSKKQKFDKEEMDKIKTDCAALLKISSRHVGGLSSYHLRPRKGFDSTSHINLDPLEYTGETMSLEEFPEALKTLQQQLVSSKTSLSSRDFPKILFLGTGSCIPNKTRNTSGILLQTSETKNILLDCGEGTCGQILRFFGPDKGDRILANIDAIYISHLHADHHIGLIGVLQARKKALDKLNIDRSPLHLFAPKQIMTWLNFYDKYFESIEDEYVLVANGEIVLNNTILAKSTKNGIQESLDLKDISTCLVKHCPNAFGVALVHKDGYKVTYSGDTMPSEQLVELGRNSDLLIHEATMEDELETEAIIKLHSTTSQAIQIGKDMQAKHVILTHFSQRYAKLPRFNDNFADNVTIAFDNMQVRLDELPLVPLLYPALKIMFAEHYEELEHKTLKRQLRAERLALAETS